MEITDKMATIKSAFEKVSGKVEHMRVAVSPLYTREAQHIATYFDTVVAMINSEEKVAKSLYRLLHTNNQVNKLNEKMDAICDRNMDAAVLSMVIMMVSDASELVIGKRGEQFAIEYIQAAAEIVSESRPGDNPADFIAKLETVADRIRADS